MRYFHCYVFCVNPITVFLVILAMVFAVVLTKVISIVLPVNFCVVLFVLFSLTHSHASLQYCNNIRTFEQNLPRSYSHLLVQLVDDR